MPIKRLESKEGYSTYACIYDDNEKYWNSFEQNYLKKHIDKSKDKDVLDIGAGTGRISMKLLKAGANVTALDLSPEMLSVLNSKSQEVKTVEGDMEDLPFEDESFDMVFSSMAMVHLKKIDTFLDEAYRVLKDDGIFVLVNIHYRKPLILNNVKGKYVIKCYNHFPRHVRKAAEELAFGVLEDNIVTEGDDVWISQVLVLKK